MIEDNEFYWKLLDALKDGVYFANTQRKITYWNKAAEEITGYRSAEVLGKFCGDNILIHIDDRGNNLCTGPCPLSRAMAEGKPCEAAVYLHHKQGHRVPVYVRINPIRDAGGEIIGAVEVFSDNSAGEQFLQRAGNLKERQLQDPVSEIPNRRYIEMKLQTSLGELKAYGWSLGLVYLRLEGLSHLKTGGKEAAYNGALKIIGRTLMNNITPFDLVGRWQEDDFVALIHNVNADKLTETADLYRVLLEKTDFTCLGEDIRLSASVGSEPAKKEDNETSLIERARQRLAAGVSI
jgi:PAS domain S-box-containing protein/diguanylate cyclase (GGDEF)-like protein